MKTDPLFLLLHNLCDLNKLILHGSAKLDGKFSIYCDIMIEK
jgi:hypothetical protein